MSKHGGIVVIDCFATWCPPCKAIAPFVHAMSESTGVGLVKIDVDKAKDLAKAYKIQAMPTFILVQ